MEATAVIIQPAPAPAPKASSCAKKSDTSFDAILKAKSKSAPESPKAEKSEKAENAEKPERPEKTEKAEKSGRPEKGEQDQRAEKSDEGAEKPEKTEGTETSKGTDATQTASIEARLAVTVLPEGMLPVTAKETTATPTDPSAAQSSVAVSKLGELVAQSDLNIRQVEVIKGEGTGEPKLVGDPKVPVPSKAPEVAPQIPQGKTAQPEKAVPVEAQKGSVDPQAGKGVPETVAQQQGVVPEAKVAAKDPKGPVEGTEKATPTKVAMPQPQAQKESAPKQQGEQEPRDQELPAKQSQIAKPDLKVELEKVMKETLEPKSKEPKEPKESKVKEPELLQAQGVVESKAVKPAEARSAVKEPVAVQVVRQSQEAIKSGRTEVRIKLDPENLGGITLRVVSKNGVVSANIVTDSPQTKEIIEGQLAGLKNQFADQGIRLDRIQIAARQEAAFDFSGQQQRQSFQDGQQRPSHHTYYAEEPVSNTPDEPVSEGAIDYRA